MICGRRSLVRGIRLLVFHRMYDGPYNVKKKKQKKTVQKTAVSRIMVAALKMSFFFKSAVAAEMGSKPTRQTRSDSPMHTCTVGRRSEN